MEDKKKVPRLRFPGFTDDWKQRKSGEIAPLRGGFAFKSNEYCAEGVPIVRISNILSDGSVGADFANYDEQDDDEAYALYDGAAVLAMSGATTGKVSVLHAEKGHKYYQNQRVGYFMPTDNCDYGFIRTLMKSQLFADQLSAVLVAGAQPNVSSKEIDGFEYMIPQSKEEQHRIGEYFSNLDTLIALHQRQLDNLKNLKKGCLQKMFPKYGETKPELRFPGFTDDWEQRKLSEVVTEIKRTDEKSDAPIMMITAENGFINQSERYSTNNAGQSLKKYILLEKGELAYNHGASKLRPYGSCFALTTEEKARIPFVYHCFSTETENSEFLSIVLNGKAVEKQLRRIVSSGARMDGLLNISFDEYTSIPVMLPRKDEQDRIAEYFKNLDHLITLHQRELDELNQFKKGMLQQMFV